MNFRNLAILLTTLPLWVSCSVDIGQGSQLSGQRCFQESDCAGGLTCLERSCVPLVTGANRPDRDAGGDDGSNNGVDNNGVNNGFNNPTNNGVDNNGVNNGFNNPTNNQSECRPTARRCISEVSYQECVSTDRGDFFETRRCPDGLFCEAGECVDPQTCTDADGDQYGIGCRLGPDCDDNNPSVFPNRPEQCGNGLDDNCNGGIDEGCDTDGCCPGGCGMSEFCTTECACVPYDPLVCEYQSQPCAQEGAFFNDFYCISIDGFSQPRCWGVCDVNADDPSSTCPDPNSVCAFDSGDGQNGLCFGSCGIADDGSYSCPTELGCLLIDVDDGPGICTPTNTANGPGDQCNPDSFWDCQDGYVCVDIQGNGRGRCRQACRPFEHGGANTFGTDCFEGHCLPFSSALGICFRDNQSSVEGEQCQPQYTMCNDDALVCYPSGQFGGECYRTCRPSEGDVDCGPMGFCESQDPENDIGLCVPR